MDSIKQIRKTKGLTQVEAAKLTEIPLRTFKNYENDSSKQGNIKYNYILHELEKVGYIDETHGVLSLDKIKESCEKVLKKFDVEYAILFGSYASGKANETSDVDILLSTSISGMKFYGIVEELRTSLNKKVDILNLDQLTDNKDLLNEILRDGVKVYVKEGS